MTRPDASATVVVFLEIHDVTQPGISLSGSAAGWRKMLPSSQVMIRSEFEVFIITP